MATRKRELGTDARGRYKIDLGRKANDAGKLVPHRFLLGADRAEAERRAEKLRLIWQRVESGHTPSAQFPVSVWTPFLFRVAAAVARGEQAVTVPRGEFPSQGYAAYIVRRQRELPFVALVAEDEDHFKAGSDANAAYVARKLTWVERIAEPMGLLADASAVSGRTLHDALDAYAEYISREGERLESGELKPYSVVRLERVKRFKAAHSNAPLAKLGRDACAEMVAHWRARPVTRKGGRASAADARHLIGELFRFWRWLDEAEAFGWTAPKGLASINRKAAKFATDRAPALAVGKPIYSPGELVRLNPEATPLERLALYLGLNCAHGAAELGRIRIDDVHFGRHPYADRLRFDSTEADVFVRFFRPKTGVFGEWLLWPPVADMVRWGVERARRLGSPLLFCTETGRTMYPEGESKNAQQPFASLWKRLVDRVRKADPEFRRLPFGALRDTLPDTMRHEFDGELASTLLCHGSPVTTDALLECYTGKPFGRLHTATRKLFENYRPMFDAVPNPTDGRKRFQPSAVVRRWQELRSAGVPVATIAREAGVSAMTIRRNTSI